MALEVRIIRDKTGLQELEEAWTRLLGESDAGTVFASFPWNLAWWHAFGAERKLFVLAAVDADGQVQGIAPLMLSRAGPLRKLEFIGTGLSDTGDFVLGKSDAEEAAEAIFACLRRHRHEWDLLDLDEVPPYSPLASWLERGKPPGFHVIRLPRTDCPFIALPDSWQEYTQSLQRKPRQHLESFARRVVQETGMSFRLVTEEDDVPGAVERFYRLHLARWAAKEDALNPVHRAPAFLSFLEEACRRAAAQGLLRLAELHVGDDHVGEVIASWISFQVKDRLNGYMTGFDPGWSSKRPGKVLHGFVVRQALAEHVRELDLGRGAEEYKYEMGAVSRRNSRLMLTNNTPRSMMALALTMLRIKGREVVRRYRTGD